MILDGGDWGTFAVMAFVPYADAYIYIGEQANISTFRGIFKDAKGDSTVHFVFKERSTTITLSDIFGNVWSGTKAPSTTLFGEYIFQTKNVSITGKAMETAKVEGQGYFIQTFDGYNNYSESLFYSGFYALKLKNMDCISVNFNKFPAIGYQEIILVDDGTYLDLMDNSLSKVITLGIEKNGSSWSGDQIPVAFSDNPEMLDCLSLNAATAALGSLSYSEDDLMIYFNPITSKVTFQSGADGVSAPVDSAIYEPGESYILPSMSVTELPNGDLFCGWKNNATQDIYQPGEHVTLIGGTNTFVAVWGKKVHYVTGMDGIEVTGDLPYMEGGYASLTNNLRGRVASKDGVEYVFYGWKVDNELMYAGDQIVMPAEGITATAVWAVAVFLDPAYSGGDGNGSSAKPYTSFYDAYPALQQLLADSAYEAGSVVFVGSQTLDVAEYGELRTNDVQQGEPWSDSKGLFTYMSNANNPMFEAKLAQADKPVLFVGSTPSTRLTVTNSQTGHKMFYLAFDNVVFFDQMIININLYNITRFFMNSGGGFGPAFSTEGTTKAVAIDTNKQNSSSLSIRVYGGTLNYIYLGSSNAANKTNLYVGNNGEVTLLCMNNTHSYNSNNVILLSGAVITNLKLGPVGFDKIAKGSLSVTIRNGAVVRNIYDYAFDYSDPHNYCADMVRSLTFDGFSGSVAYSHKNIGLQGKVGNYPNGLDNISFINGSQVTFMGNDVFMKANPVAAVTFDATSSLGVGSKNIVGIENNFTSGEKIVAFPVTSYGVAIDYSWNGVVWGEPLYVTYETGFSSVTMPRTMTSAGDTVVLPNDLRHTIVTDANGIEVGFYGFRIDGKFYFAGESVTMDSNGLTATVVWVPVLTVDANYAGGDGNGTLAKPFITAEDAYLGLESIWEAYPAYEAGIVNFATDYTWDVMVEDGLFTFDNNGSRYNSILQAASKFVMFHGATDSVRLTLLDSQATKTLFYFTFDSPVGFDGITVLMASYQDTRYAQRYDMYFGPNYFVYSNSSDPIKTYTVAIDVQTNKGIEMNTWVYGGDWKFIYCGSFGANQIQNIYFGSGLSNPKTALLAVNNIPSKSIDNVIISSGTVSSLQIGAIDSMNVAGGKVVSGEIHVTIRGGIIPEIKDFNNESNQNNATRTNKYCENLVRTLVFDGFSGTTKYSHLATYMTVDQVRQYYGNGLDNLSFINGSNVTFTGNAIAMKANLNGVVYIESGSSVTGTINGIVADTANETVVAATSLAAGTNIWNGTAWSNTSNVGVALGAQIRVEAPYGIRFGFEGNKNAMSAMLGSKVTASGVLIIPTQMLTGQLSISTANVLNIANEYALSANQPDIFTGVLTDDPTSTASSESWLTAWKDVPFTARAYFTLEDGTTVYTDTIARSIQDVWNAQYA